MKKPLDRIDYEILGLLRNNARISNKDIAESVGLAASTCLVRIRLLQSSGVISGFHAEVDPSSLGVALQAMISVRLRRHFKPDVEAFREHALSLPEVVQLYHVAGPIDFLLHVWSRDSNHLRDLAMTAFTSREEVAHIETELLLSIFEVQRCPRSEIYIVMQFRCLWLLRNACAQFSRLITYLPAYAVAGALPGRIINWGFAW